MGWQRIFTALVLAGSLLLILLIGACTPDGSAVATSCPAPTEEGTAAYIPLDESGKAASDNAPAIAPPPDVGEDNSPAAPVVTDNAPAIAPPPDVPAPYVVDHSPVQGAYVPWTKDIRILFSRPMDHDTTVAAITLEPVIAYSATWHRDDMLVRLVPTAELEPFQLYRVTLSGAAVSADGVALNQPLAFTFTGEEP